MGREENVKVFQDTERLVKERKALSEAVKYSTKNQILIPEYMQVADMMPDRGERSRVDGQAGEIVVSKKRTYEAAAAYKGKKVCVHNFASATNPGGGVTKGSSAQEECLCRCSTLYFNLNTSDMWGGFYAPHRSAQDPVHNDDCIYTPEVVVFKTDTDCPKLMPEEEWYKVNVVTCAAPNLRLMPSNGMNSGDGMTRAKLSEEELYHLHVKRLSRIMEVAVAGGNEVMILGAFGCGAFENNPEVVAKASKAVAEKYRSCFAVIEFAIYCSPRDEQNYKIFSRVI
ncbi:MAG: TIGR02452 family protein [Lachnospiraceae bacterium]|nr:TIGR02452 family protein [Lachnospiraceae bacterium]